MKKYTYLISLLFISTRLFAGGTLNVNVIRSVHDDIQAQYVIPFSNSQAELGKSVWRSPNGIVCTVSLVPQLKGLPIGVFECVTPEKYKAQIAFNCTRNINKQTSAYLFFGKIGDYETFGNFYVWCDQE